MSPIVVSGLVPVTLVTAALASGVVFAQAMTDPTRPPTEYTEVDSSAPAASGPVLSSAPAAGGPVLQSVMITPTLKAAIINGEIVKLGGKFGNAQLMKISENEVVLKSEEQTLVLKMYPGVEKRESTRGAPKAASARAAGQKKPTDAGTGDAR